jgi:hypothetical protein
MTPERTAGNFFGSFIDWVMGMTLLVSSDPSDGQRPAEMTHSPTPSKAKTAVPTNNGKESLLNMTTSATPFFAIVENSFEAIYTTISSA